jgi:glycosyltransferase involved in cell wall biosynthesis
VTGDVVSSSHNVRDLVEAIEGLMLDDERRSRYARQAREFALANFSWESLSSKLSTGLEPFDHFEPASSRA